MVTIDDTRLSRLLAEAHLVQGSGKGANGTIDVCIMQAVDWITGGKGKSDAPGCVDPAIRRFCIRLNDAERFAQWRDELKPFAARMANTKAGDAATITRGFITADHSIRVIAPLAFEFWAAVTTREPDKAKALSWAEKMRACPPITDSASALVGANLAREARASAADAASAAYAADAAYSAYAADAAYAASAASGASAASAADAASSADGASAASAADAADAASAASAAYAADAASGADAADAAYSASAADAADAADSAYAASATSATYAASAAYAAYAASGAYAASSASGASAASAADARSKANALARALWDEALVLLDRMIRVTEVAVP
jgi:hypothetical protein